MLNDEHGQCLKYDTQGRLIAVMDSKEEQLLVSYRYDGHNHLVGVRQGDKETLRFYQGYSLMRLRRLLSSPYQTVGAASNRAITDAVPGLITLVVVSRNQSLSPCLTRS